MQALTFLAAIMVVLGLFSIVICATLRWGNTIDQKSDDVVTRSKPMDAAISKLAHQTYEGDGMRQKPDLAGQLRKLSELYADGYLSADEFRSVKAMLLSSQTRLDIQEAGEQAVEVENNGVSNSRKISSKEPLFGEGASNTVFLLAVINIVVFVLMLLQNPSHKWDAEFLLSWGADYGGLTLNGQPWRLITSTFVHLSFVHLAGNMSALGYWGRTTEQALGSGLFLLVYCLCGLSASVVSVEINPQVVSAGASGALAGLLGVMCVMWLRGDSRVDAQDILGNLAFNVLLSVLAGVDWVAHVGGLVSGIFLGSLFLRSRQIDTT